MEANPNLGIGARGARQIACTDETQTTVAVCYSSGSDSTIVDIKMITYYS